MNALLNLENHMDVDNNLLDAPDLNQKEIRVMFQNWLENQESDTHYFELFLENWMPSELLTFSMLGRTQSEFKKWQAEYLQKEFENATGERISQFEIMQEI
ncbi:hypothetical protein THIOSC15_3050006 [uncultured Thiomicrorhabdus sp.]